MALAPQLGCDVMLPLAGLTVAAGAASGRGLRGALKIVGKIDFGEAGAQFDATTPDGLVNPQLINHTFG